MREKLIDLITSYFGVDPAYYGIEVAHLADYLIESGVVIPVRCKDCIYNETGGCEHSESADVGYSPDYFCADGERKDNV